MCKKQCGASHPCMLPLCSDAHKHLQHHAGIACLAHHPPSLLLHGRPTALQATCRHNSRPTCICARSSVAPTTRACHHQADAQKHFQHCSWHCLSSTSPDLTLHGRPTAFQVTSQRHLRPSCVRVRSSTAPTTLQSQSPAATWPSCTTRGGSTTRRSRCTSGRCASTSRSMGQTTRRWRTR